MKNVQRAMSKAEVHMFIMREKLNDIETMAWCVYWKNVLFANYVIHLLFLKGWIYVILCLHNEIFIVVDVVVVSWKRYASQNVV